MQVLTPHVFELWRDLTLLSSRLFICVIFVPLCIALISFCTPQLPWKQLPSCFLAMIVTQVLYGYKLNLYGMSVLAYSQFSRFNFSFYLRSWLHWAAAWKAAVSRRVNHHRASQSYLRWHFWLSDLHIYLAPTRGLLRLPVQRYCHFDDRLRGNLFKVGIIVSFWWGFTAKTRSAIRSALRTSLALLVYWF